MSGIQEKLIDQALVLASGLVLTLATRYLLGISTPKQDYQRHIEPIINQVRTAVRWYNIYEIKYQFLGLKLLCAAYREVDHE